MKPTMRVLLGAAALACSANGAAGQGATITPQLGVYIPASSFYELRDQANTVKLEKEGTLALGLAVETDWLRGSLAYATGATLNEHGVGDRQDIGNGSVLAAAADVVLRPLPRILVQPYLLAGVGLKNVNYDPDADATDLFPEDLTEFAGHFGLGADLFLGGIGLAAEVSDFISRDPDGSWKQHDAFATVGLKFRL
ncbi:MAG: hypothetical protein FIB01_03145 [Gemmatimonadetes bacterium]|nr:hypothetical protein [Gemmatimonadota bacterium]